VREYYNQKINLYSAYGFYIEVFYSPSENKIANIQIARPETLEKLYSINLSQND